MYKVDVLISSSSQAHSTDILLSILLSYGEKKISPHNNKNLLSLFFFIPLHDLWYLPFTLSIFAHFMLGNLFLKSSKLVGKN